MIQLRTATTLSEEKMSVLKYIYFFRFVQNDVQKVSYDRNDPEPVSDYLVIDVSWPVTTGREKSLAFSPLF